MSEFTFRRVYGSRFYAVRQWVDGQCFTTPAVCDDFGQLVLVGVA